MSIDAAMEVLHQGDSSGNDMIIKATLSSGREIFGFATKNTYGGDWDLGPTWNYVVSSERPFLVDTGRRGMGRKLLEMMDYAGVRGNDLAFVMLSHGHEDHDGGLFALANTTGATVLAHKTYEKLIRIYPGMAPSPETDRFPASCWDCRMPVAFYEEHCLAYHRQRDTLEITDLFEFREHLDDGISILHAPGHSPDAVAVLIDGEALLIGDTILPDITPHPTREAVFAHTKSLLPDEYTEAQQLYGLRAYLRSLRDVIAFGHNSAETLLLPAHRLFYRGKWNHVELEQRVHELFAHHTARCHDILRIIANGPTSAEEIAKEHFAANLLKGSGLNLAVNEVLSHCEILEISGDVVWHGDHVVATDQNPGFEALIKSLGEEDD